MDMCVVGCTFCWVVVMESSWPPVFLQVSTSVDPLEVCLHLLHMRLEGFSIAVSFRDAYESVAASCSCTRA